ncbi:MAG: hypothetical protein QM811_30855 [Pirellulales bacterium]
MTHSHAFATHPTIAATAARAGSIVWCAAGVLVFVRAAGGHFSHGTSSLGMIALAVCGAAITVALSDLRDIPRTSFERIAPTPVIALLLWGVALTIAGSGATGIVLLWTIIAAAIATVGWGSKLTAWSKPSRAVEHAPFIETNDQAPINSVEERVAPRLPTLGEPAALEDLDDELADDELPWLWHEPRRRRRCDDCLWTTVASP